MSCLCGGRPAAARGRPGIRLHNTDNVGWRFLSRKSMYSCLCYTQIMNWFMASIHAGKDICPVPSKGRLPYPIIGRGEKRICRDQAAGNAGPGTSWAQKFIFHRPGSYFQKYSLLKIALWNESEKIGFSSLFDRFSWSKIGPQPIFRPSDDLSTHHLYADRKEAFMDKMPRADLGPLQEQGPERSEKDREMTFDEFLDRCFDRFEELAELDEDLPFTDD